MLEKKNSLPRAELHFSIDYRNRFTRARQNHPNVRRHIIGTFIVVFVARILRHELFEKSLNITAR